MGLEPEPDPVSRLRQLHAISNDCEGKTCVVIFDEAQHLDAESLETIRMLSNFETPRQKLIQFVLSGQPALAGNFCDRPNASRSCSGSALWRGCSRWTAVRLKPI